MTGRLSTRPSQASPGVRSQMAIAQSAPTCSRPSASTAYNRRRTSSTPAPKRERTSGSRLMSRNSITPARAARTSRRCCHSMPALQTGHFVLYQTVSVELISNLAGLDRRLRREARCGEPRDHSLQHRKGLPFCLDLWLRAGIDHILVIGGKLVMQPIGSMSEKIAMFMHGAALDSDIGPQCCKRLLEAGRAVDDDKFRRFQAALDEIVEKRPPGGFAFAAHVLDRQENLLSVLSHAEGDKQGNRGRFLVEPDAHDRAIEDEADDRLCGE